MEDILLSSGQASTGCELNEVRTIIHEQARETMPKKVDG